ncbi:MAG: hypothetical protein OEY93_04635 [Anaerolineae bacterium]|nr:hypothetical protein [Anaerolineae bacterium]
MMNPKAIQSSQRYETSGSSIWLDEEGIVHTEVKAVPEMTVEIVQEDIAVFEKICADFPRPFLGDIQNMSRMPREARVLAAKEAPRFVSANALVANSPISRVIGNLFLGLNRPEIPIRMFDDEESALDWLRGFLEQK